MIITFIYILAEILTISRLISLSMFLMKRTRSGCLVPSPLQKEHGKCPVGDSKKTARLRDEEPSEM